MADRKLSTRKTSTRKAGRAVRVHGIDDARAACDAARAVGAAPVLWSPPFGSAQMGPLWFQQMMLLIGEEFPDLSVEAVLDCGNAPGHALAALRQGVTAIALTARPEVRRKIEAIAAQSGARLVRRPAHVFTPAPISDEGAGLRKWFDRRS